jgi:flagellar motor switch/type III secretory pathway protein FliN
MAAAQTPAPETSAGERVELETLQPIASEAMAISTRQIVERLPVVLTVELGRTTVSVKDHKIVGEPFGIFANGQRLASGEVVSVAQDKYGVRVIALAEEPDQPPEESA